MVFRDYVQGAYRMRGIGAGQQVHLYLIPEVRVGMLDCWFGSVVGLTRCVLWQVVRLMQRELALARDYMAPGVPGCDGMLRDVVAWLVINSMRSEQTQWSMLCLQVSPCAPTLCRPWYACDIDGTDMVAVVLT